MHLEVVEDNPEFLALNKPANIHSIPLKEVEQLCFSHLALQSYPELANVSDDPRNAGFISRLDFVTSGLIIAARNQATWSTLRSFGKSEDITKTYLAVLTGKTEGVFAVQASIGSRYRRSKKVSCFEGEAPSKFRAQSAYTEFSTIAYNQDLNISLVEAKIHLGRRHQIRAHSAHAGHPLVGDKQYGSNLEPISDEVKFLLHSHKIEFNLNGQEHSIKAPLPNYFDSVINSHFH